MKRFGVLVAVSSLALFACPPTGVVCQAGTQPCGQGCADMKSDVRNCGGCGNACRLNQKCSDSLCACADGFDKCGGDCVVLATDPKNCGACGKTCGTGEVCEAGKCRGSCTQNVTQRCGDSCVDTQSDLQNCGTCGVVCEAPKTCLKGRCQFDVIAACFTSGQLVPVNAAASLGTKQRFGSNPAALATLGTQVFAADGIDARLYQGRLSDGAQYRLATRTGAQPNHVLVNGSEVYVVNSGDNTLQVLQAGALTDGGDTFDLGSGLEGGTAFQTIGSLNFGANTFPEVAIKSGSTLYVPLYGGVGATNADAGQQIARVDISNPRMPTLLGKIDLRGADLKAFDGGSPGVARPYAGVFHRGFVYVVLSNLNPSTYVPEGPGLLAKVNPADQTFTLIDLGAERCLNPIWAASDGTRLFVSCAGAAVYSGAPNFNLLATDRAGVVMLDETDAVTSGWSAACPVADAGCAPVLPSRLTVSGPRVWVGDQSAGRLFLLEVSDGGLVERRGVSNPVQACTPDMTTQNANVADVLALP